MRALLSWLQDYVEIPEAPAEIAETLTMAGLAVDAVEREGSETILEFDITSNRPDCMNHFGIAREIAALKGRPLKSPSIEFPEDPRPVSSAASIEILDEDLCRRYVGRVLLGVEIGPSPDWLRRRLELCGQRSINNIADLTNYVLLDLGHPTHAFDIETLRERKIVVRRAVAGETLRTLDGVERALSPEHLVIADASRPVALAGVMGGFETEISDSTRDVLIEAAWFQPGVIRKTSRALGLQTEASRRFERGADVEAASWASDRIAGLLGRISPGVVLQGRLDVYPGRVESPTIPLRRARVARVLGVEIADREVERTLGALGFEPTPSADGWTARRPSHRLDVEREIDLIEEVGRVHGYDGIAPTLPVIGKPPAPVPREAEDRALRETLRALGYDETIGYAFTSEAEARKFSDEPPIPLRNPFSELAGVLRSNAVPTLLRAAEWNYHREETDLRLMEIGRLYRGGNGVYEEPPVLTLAATGSERRPTVFEAGRPIEFHDLKADVEALLERFDFARVGFDERETPSYYVSGRAARLLSENGLIGYAGEIEPRLCAERKIRQPVYVAEIFLDALYEAGLRPPRHRELPRLPAVHRDFSLLVPEGIPFGEIRNAIGPSEYMTAIEPIEIFRGERIPSGFYGLLLRIAWRRNTESFTDGEVNEYAARIVSDLERKLRIQLRT